MPWKMPEVQVDRCHRSGNRIYTADHPIKIEYKEMEGAGKEKSEVTKTLMFLPNSFTCKASGVKLNRNNYIVHIEKEKGEDGKVVREVYHKQHAPKYKAHVPADSHDSQRIKSTTANQSSVRYKSANTHSKPLFVQNDGGVVGGVFTKSDGGKSKFETTAEESKPEMVKGTVYELEETEPLEAPAHEPEPAAADEDEGEATPAAAPAPSSPAKAQKKYIADYDYTGGDADEVSFSEGDVLINIEVAGDGWVTATNEKTGESGMCPSNYMTEAEEVEPEPEPEPVEQWVAEYDYEAGDGDEIGFAEGDIIINVEVAGDGWITGTVESTGARGMAPSNYIKKVGE